MDEALPDSNIVIALLYDNDKFHEEAVSLVSRIKKPYVPVVAIPEIIYSLLKDGVPLTLLRDAIQGWLNLIEVTGDDITFALAARISITYITMTLMIWPY